MNNLSQQTLVDTKCPRKIIINCINVNVDVYDPWVSHEEAMAEYGLKLITEPEKSHYDAIIIAVAHKEFIAMGAEKIHMLGKNKHVLFDIKYVLNSDDVDGRL